MTTEDLQAAILAIPELCPPADLAYHNGYSRGHRDARHAAAELVAEHAPGWHKRPTCPGRYVYIDSGWQGVGSVHLQTADHVHGALSGWYFGPLPAPPKEGTAE
jgi:hypothetical protein